MNKTPWTERSFWYQCWALAGRLAVIWLAFSVIWTLITLIVLAGNGYYE